MGKELKPGSIEFINATAPIPRITSLKDCTEISITLQFQDNSKVLAHGPGQQQSKWAYRMGKLRLLLDRASVSMDF
jgi:hypothetical protein